MYRSRLAIAALLLSTIVLGGAVFASGSAYISWSRLSTLFSHPKTGPVRSTHQGITGNATMGFWAIVCTPVTNRVGPDLNITGPHGQIDQYALTWNTIQNPLYSCDSLSTFQIELQPGTYSITIDSLSAAQCHKAQPSSFGGLTCNLPYQVDVEPGQYSTVSLFVGGGL